MRIFHRAVIAILTVLVFSCAQTQFPDFTVESCDFTQTEVTVTFSAEPNQYMFVKAFTLKEDNSNVNGTFVFEGNKAMFIPDEGIRDDYQYELVISTDMEDVNGNSLERKYETSYTTRTDFTRPEVVSITPLDETNVDSQVEEIVFEFSKPVDLNSFRSAFSLSPSAEYIITTEQDDAVIKVKPAELLKKNTRYDVKVSTKLADKHRNFLLNDFESTFTNYNDEQIPGYKVYWNDGTSDVVLSSSVKNENITKDAELIIEFDEKIDINYITSYVEFTPSLSVQVTPDRNTKNTASIIFTEDIIWGSEYNLKVLKGLKDLCGNEIEEDTNYTIVFNNEKNRPVTMEKVLIDLKNGAAGYDEITNYCAKTFEVANFPTTGTTIPTNVYAIFSISSQADTISDLSVMNAFNIEYTNTCFSTFITKTVSIMTAAQIEADASLKSVYDGITPDGGKLCVVQLGVEIVNSSNANVGMLIVSFDKDVKDSLGNSMNERLEYHINKQ